MEKVIPIFKLLIFKIKMMCTHYRKFISYRFFFPFFDSKAGSCVKGQC